MVDGPQGFKSQRAAGRRAVTSDLAIVRFHGRRTATWEATGVPTVERFRYLYEARRAGGVGAAGPRGRHAGARTPTS